MATSTTQITAPRVDFLDQRTGKISREWYMFLYNLYTITGAGTGVTPVINGGTGLSSIPSNGQLLIGNGTGYTLNTLGFGAGISVTNGSGTIIVANTGVLSNIAGAGISVSGATGNVTIANTGVLSFAGGTTGLTPAVATTGAVTLAGTLIAVNGGTGQSSYATGDLLYANTTTTLAKLADVATGNALISGGVNTAPSWGKIGLTTHVSGVLPIANGGTNSTATPTAGAVAYGTGTAYAFTAAGTSGQVLTSAGAGTPTWATPTTGTVTAVSVVSANGLAGTSSGGATPALTLSTSITGILKGNGTAISAAASGTDYAPATSGTSILYGNGSGGFSNVTVGSGLSFTAGTLASTASTATAPLTKTADFTVGVGETWFINNKSGSTCTVTLPSAATYTGRELTFKNMQAQTLVSASSNVVPIDSTSAGTSILLAVVGNWATMVSDGINWVIMQQASNNNLLLE
jgi:hypothetical protein